MVACLDMFGALLKGQWAPKQSFAVGFGGLTWCKSSTAGDLEMAYVQLPTCTQLIHLETTSKGLFLAENAFAAYHVCEWQIQCNYNILFWYSIVVPSSNHIVPYLCILWILLCTSFLSIYVYCGSMFTHIIGIRIVSVGIIVVAFQKIATTCAMHVSMVFAMALSMKPILIFLKKGTCWTMLKIKQLSTCRWFIFFWCQKHPTTSKNIQKHTTTISFNFCYENPMGSAEAMCLKVGPPARVAAARRVPVMAHPKVGLDRRPVWIHWNRLKNQKRSVHPFFWDFDKNPFEIGKSNG